MGYKHSHKARRSNGKISSSLKIGVECSYLFLNVIDLTAFLILIAIFSRFDALVQDQFKI